MIVIPYLVQKSNISSKRQAYEQEKWHTIILFFPFIFVHSSILHGYHSSICPC